MSRLAEATLVLATDPDGARHVLLSATRSGGPRDVRHSLVGLSSDARAGSLSQLVAPTRLVHDDELADLLAHLVCTPAPDRGGAGRRAVDVVTLCGAEALPERLNGPFGRDFELRAVDPRPLVGDALLVANAHAPGGPWWAPVAGAGDDLVLFGHLLARAGLLGPSSRCLSTRTPHDAPAPFDGLDAAALEASLRGTEPPPGGSDVRLQADEGRVRWNVHTAGGDATSFTTPQWQPEQVSALDAARQNALAPYALLVFAAAPATGELRLARVVGARRHLVGAVEAREPQRELV